MLDLSYKQKISALQACTAHAAWSAIAIAAPSFLASVPPMNPISGGPMNPGFIGLMPSAVGQRGDVGGPVGRGQEAQRVRSRHGRGRMHPRGGPQGR